MPPVRYDVTSMAICSLVTLFLPPHPVVPHDAHFVVTGDTTQGRDEYPEGSTNLQGSQRIGVRLIRTLPLGSDVFFGEVSDVDQLEDGSVVVLDNLSHHVLIFRPDGALDRTIGRQGGGPGEIGGAAEIEIGPDETIVLLDYRHRRFTRWNRAGEVLGTVSLRTSLPAGVWPHDFLWTPEGPLVKYSYFVPDAPFHIVRMTDDLAAVRDTVVTLTQADSLTCLFCPWTVSRSGNVRVARGDTLYVLNRLDRTGRIAGRWSYTFPAARYTEAELERRRNEARNRGALEGGGAEPSPFKQRFTRLSLGTDGDGRLWALPSQQGDRTTIHVFRDGAAAPQVVEIPYRLTGFRLRGNWLLGIGEDAVGAPVVHVFEVEP